MPDNDAPRRSEPAGSVTERSNLPVPISRPSEVARDATSWVGRILRTMFGWKPGSIRADLELVLDAGVGGESGFSPEERAMLKNILGLRERRLDDVMVPRADIIAVQQNIAIGELVKVFEGAGHSRLVVYDDTLDDPAGMVHIRDLIAYMTKRAAESAAAKSRRRKPFSAGLDLKAVDLSVALSSTSLVRTILFVPPSMPAIDLLAKMQATRIHLALVIDEYGGTDGLVSIEDIVEQIVGDIEDEHDEAEAANIMADPKLGLVMQARTPVRELESHLGLKLLKPEEEEDIDTLGGLVFALLGRVPARGELIRHPAGLEFEVLDADPRRVKKLRIHHPRPKDGPAPAKG